MPHTKLSPSASSRWLACPGSVRLSAGIPSKDNEYTLKGTAAHQVAEACLRNGMTPGGWVGENVEVKGADGITHNILFTEEDANAVFTYIEYILTRKQKTGYVSMIIEEQVNPGLWLGQRDDLKGIADCILYANDYIEIIDYKHGSGMVVDPEENTQLLLYALGACARVNWQKENYQPVIIMTIVQPRAPSEEGPVRSWVIPAKDLFERIPALTIAALATDGPDAPLVPGDKQCRFCPAKATCPALKQDALAVFNPVGTGGWDEIEKNLGKPADQLTVSEMTHILDKAPLIKAWLQAVLDAARDMALEGTEIPGYKLVETVTKRKWSLDNDAMLKRLAGLNVIVKEGEKQAKVGKARVCEERVISVAQAEKLVKPLITERSWNNIQKLIVRPEGKPTLVPSTDSRDPVKTATQVFQQQAQPTAPAPWD